MAKKKRRTRTPHPGVKLKKRTLQSGATAWRALYEDPDTGRPTYVTLDALALPSLEARRAWAVSKSKVIARRRMELESGAARKTGVTLTNAIERYFAAHPHLRSRTKTIYRTATNKLIAWAEGEGIESGDELTRARLVSFRERLASAPKRVPAKEGMRGRFRTSAAARSPASVNQDLRAVRTVLGYLHDLDLLPKLSSDDLRRALKMMKAAQEAPEFLSVEACQRLVQAALLHDAAVFQETREEHAGLRRPGTTARHSAVAPFLTTVLLTGMRLGEALALKWSDVDLGARDADGETVGEIRLRALATKTSRARTISLDVSPAVRKLLTALKQSRVGPYVFGEGDALSRDLVESTRERLLGRYDAPTFSWQMLRSTCATVQCNAPSLFGAAAAFMSAKRLGHSVVVSERRYAGQVAVSKSARTLEAAMGIADLMDEVVHKSSRLRLVAGAALSAGL
jgi:integrase